VYLSIDGRTILTEAKEIGYECVTRVYGAQDWNQWWSLLKKLLYFRLH
jgi:transcription elongation factor GreA-like protein